MPLNSAATPQQQKKAKKKKTSKKLEFSKKLSIVDIICWAVITVLLLIVMLVQPSLASYCVGIFNASTAAYVSLRLGYTAKAGVENYKKIAQNYTNIVEMTDDVETNG